jgi:epoxide hydrolase
MRRGQGAATRPYQQDLPEFMENPHSFYKELTTRCPVHFTDRSPADQARLAKIKQLQTRQPAYQALHATRPQTISYALTDSPAGLLAWIAEKFTEWADPRATITLDQILTDVSIYWFTATAGSSARLANESPRGKVPCPVSVWVVVLPYDILQSARPLAEQDDGIVHWTECDRGGHFSGLEIPDLLAADVCDFSRKLQTP